jgi:bla regulator protein blaR1
MMLRYLSSPLAAVGPAVANHLWQSTLFAVMAALLVLVLRKDHARVRYWLWLAASVKFLVPFGWFVALGSLFALPATNATAQTQVYFAVAEVSQPFAQPARPFISVAPASPAASNLLHLLPLLLVAIWFCGFAAVLFTWCVRWRRMSRLLRSARRLSGGREVEELRRLERTAGIRKPIPILLSHASLEPGIFGIARPALVLPEGISKRLDDAQLKAVLAHEVWHVRRRDNLAAAAHMVVEALFWFHPLVWWLGGKLMEERERACDEEVLQLGHEPQVYAESILKTCEYCVTSSLQCAPGITTANLEKRISQIMRESAGRKLNFPRKLLLCVAAFTAVALPFAVGMADTQKGESAQVDFHATKSPKFNVVSIKLFKSDASGQRFGFSIADPPYDGTFNATDVTLRDLIGEAYGVHHSQLIMGAPSWVSSVAFDIEAKSDTAVNDALRGLSPAEGKLVKQGMLRELLADRFKMIVHRENKKLSVYALVVAKNGPKFQESKPGDSFLSTLKNSNGDKLDRPGVRVECEAGGQCRITGYAISTETLAQMLWGFDALDAPVVDRTGLDGSYHPNFFEELLIDLHIVRRTAGGQSGLKGKYDIDLQWTSAQGWPAAGGNHEGGRLENPEPPAPESSTPSIFKAIQEQLGLKLKPAKAALRVFVIDHVEQPSVD